MFSASVYLKETILFSVFVFLVFISVVSPSPGELIFFTLAFLCGIVLLLNYVGKSRGTEVFTLLKTISGIRQNRINAPEEIKLTRNLYELEGEIKSMYLRTKNDIENLKKLEQVRTEFLGNVSHELRTPIFAIQGYLETLLDGAIDDNRVNRNFTAKAYHHTNNLNNLLNDLIDISMIESGQMKMSFRYFHIKDYLEEIAGEMSLQAEEKGLKLELGDIKPKMKLFGDKNRLRQVLVNLISNAIKYTEVGGVEILVSEEDGFGRITIKDSGLGISEKDLGRIFERFYRVDKDRSRAVGGTGLGLAIVKHILDAHGSKIEVQSQYGIGSEFSFKLKK